MLLQAGANLMARTRLGGYTPLALAAEDGHEAVAAALVSGGADVNAADTSGTTVLMLAAASGNVEHAARCSSSAAPIVTRANASMEQTALMFAAAAQPRRRDQGRCWRAARARRDQQSRESRGADRRGPPAPAGAPAGGRAAARGRGGAGRRRRHGSPVQLQRAGRHAGRSDAVALRASDRVTSRRSRALVDAGADVNQVSAGDKTSPLLMAIINGHFDLAQYLHRARRRRRRSPTPAASRRSTPRSTSSGARSRCIRSPGPTCSSSCPISI